MSERLPFLEHKYEVLGKLKEGGMGAVYKVRHRLLDEIRVVKVMRPQLADDPGFADRFNREARAAIRLRHPNIAQLFDFTLDDNGNAYMVLEFVDGLDLKEVLRRHGPLPIGLTLEIAVQALSAVGFLHRRGMVHRDISPDNLMLSRDEDGRPMVKLIDLGIIKVLDAEGMTTTGIFLGKVRYASPEQFRSVEGGSIDQRSDLYSVGVVLYELLTGTFPISGDTSSAIMAGHLYHPPLGFETSDPAGRVPPALRNVVLRLLEKDPSRRFQSADELASQLVALQREFPVRTEDLDRCCPRAATAAGEGVTRLASAADGFGPRPAAPESRRAASMAPPSAALATAPTLLLPEAYAGDERAGELVAAFDRCLERGELEEAASLLAQARTQLGEGEVLSRLEQRLARLRQACAHPTQSAMGGAVAAGSAPGPSTPTQSRRLRLFLAVVGAVTLVAALALGGLVVLRRTAPRAQLLPEQPAGAAAVSATPQTGWLVVHALPWAKVVEVTDATGAPVTLPDDAVTPMAVALPPGNYTIRVRHPELPEVRSTTAMVTAGATTTVTVEVVAQSVDSFLAKMGW